MIYTPKRDGDRPRPFYVGDPSQGFMLATDVFVQGDVGFTDPSQEGMRVPHKNLVPPKLFLEMIRSSRG